MVSKEDMKGYFENIYEKLDNVSPIDFDCGQLCGEICCVYGNDDNQNEETALYLLPGEELMYEHTNSFDLYYIDFEDEGFEINDGKGSGGIYLVKCINPPNCNRDIRPIQCRTFPLAPHISENGEFHLVLDATEFPYLCPIIEDNIELNDDFLSETFNVWKKFIKHPIVRDWVEEDSRLRDERFSDYKVMI